MSGELMRVVFQCMKCERDLKTLQEIVAHLSNWDRDEEGCPTGRIINVRVIR